MNGRLLAWSLTIATVVALVPAVGAQAVPQGVIPIAGDVEYADGTFVFRENLVVGPGATLTFRDAVVYLEAPKFCPTRGSAGYCQPSILLDGGTLRILDSVVDSRTWTEHDFESGWSVAGISSTLDIRGSTLLHYKSLGTQLPGGARSLVADNVFTDARGSLSFTRGAEADVTGNAFQRVYTGVIFTDSESALVGNVFRDVGRDYGAGLFGRAIDVQSTVVGDKGFRALTLVKDNLVENAFQGMLNLNGFPNDVRDNVFRSNLQALTIGISVGDDILHSEAPNVVGNVFEDNGDAILVYTSGVYRTPEGHDVVTIPIHENSFLGTDCMEIDADQVSPRVTLTVDARDNWWGTAAGPQDHGPGCPAFAGAVLHDPWLTQAP